jgi:glutathione S-transferase
MLIYGDSISGNCLKVKWTADQLGIPYRWVEVNVLKGESRTPEYLAMNPAGQVPIVQLDGGHTLAQSNAIILYLAEGSGLIPSEPFARAKMMEWLFWEQYSHEPTIAVARFQVRYLGRPVADLDPSLISKGNAALRLLDETLTAQGDFLLGARFSLADVSLVAYTRTAGEGGFDLSAYPSVVRWVGSVETVLGLKATSHSIAARSD